MKASELMIGDYIMTPLQKGTVIGNIEEIDTSFDAPDVCHITIVRVITGKELTIKDNEQ